MDATRGISVAGARSSTLVLSANSQGMTPGLGDGQFLSSPPGPGNGKVTSSNSAPAISPIVRMVVAAPATSVSPGSVALTAIVSLSQPFGSPRSSPFSTRPPRWPSASSLVRPTDPAPFVRPPSTQPDAWTLQANPVNAESLGFLSWPTENGRPSARGNREAFQASIIDAIVQACSNVRGTLDPASADEIADDVLIARKSAGVRSQHDSTEAEASGSPSRLRLALGVPAIVLGAWARIWLGNHPGRNPTDEVDAE